MPKPGTPRPAPRPADTPSALELARRWLAELLARGARSASSDKGGKP
jgi:hypothetical protein